MTDLELFGDADRAVSEVIAFVLIFSIVITSVGLLYTVGFGSLNQIQETEQDHSGERAIRALAVALDDIQMGRGSNRAANLDLAGRTISVDDSEQLEVTLSGGGSVTAQGAFTYRGGGDTVVVYQSGAVIRSEGDDAQLVQRAPRFRCTGEHAVVSLVNVTQATSGAYSSGGSVQILAEQQNPADDQLVAQQTGGSVDVTVDFSASNYETAWERYFEQADGWSASGGTATCSTDQAYVRMTEIQLEYLGV